MELGVSSDDLCRMLRAFPALLRLSVEDEMRPCVQFLRDVGIGNVVSRGTAQELNALGRGSLAYPRASLTGTVHGWPHAAKSWACASTSSRSWICTA